MGFEKKSINTRAKVEWSRQLEDANVVGKSVAIPARVKCCPAFGANENENEMNENVGASLRSDYLYFKDLKVERYSKIF